MIENNASTDNVKAGWLFKMAWRDGRSSRRRLVLFMASIILGIAAIVAIQSFGENLKQSIADQSKTLLGADLVIDTNKPVVGKVQDLMDSINGEKARELNFASMVAFPKTGDTRLVQVRALEGDFPFYGAIETIPVAAALDFKQGRQTLVDATVMLQFGVNTGDSIKVGDLTFKIAGSVSRVPGQSGIAATVAPPVYVPMQYIGETGLLQKGSRIRYHYYFKLAPGTDVEKFAESIDPVLDEEGIRINTPASTARSIGRSYENVGRFLNLIAFVSLLLGCIGVASAIHVYIKEKLGTVAVLRCIGATRRQTFLIFLIQIIGIGLGGSIIGALLGTIIQQFFPLLFQEFLPVALQLAISWKAVATGISIGVIMAILFALLPLLAIWDISPLHVLRVSDQDKKPSLNIRLIVFGLIIGFIFLFSYWQLQNWQYALAFTGGVLVSFAILAGMGTIFMKLIKRFFPASWSFVARQSLLNLFRPQNQTLMLILSIGLGSFLISTLYFSQDMLLNEVTMQAGENDPNLIVFDIQNDQKKPLADMVIQQGLPVLQQVPIVTMRLHSIKGRDIKEIQADSTTKIRDWILHREYRVTYQSDLTAAETVVEGEWIGEVENPDDTIFISVEEGAAEDMKATVGDALVFNVQGVLMETIIGSIRAVDWRRLQTNFIVVFPKGVLENAPQFHVLATRVPNNVASAKLQQSLVRQFPNVAIVDLKQVLITIKDILDKIAWVISFMALFSIITGFIVLISAVRTSKYQRIKESVLLRTLGARQQQIFTITGLEYFFLGSLASISGIALALLSSWLLALYSFDTAFIPSFMPPFLLFLGITLLTVVIGLTNSRSVIKSAPLEVLRKEIQ